MRHLDDNDMSRMIDNNVTSEERERFQQHLAYCKECLFVYSEALKFMDAGKNNILALRRITPFPRQKLIAAAVAVLAVFLGFYFLYLGLSGPDQSPSIKLLARLSKERQESNIHRFGPDRRKRFASVRLGILWEDFSLLQSEPDEKELRQRIRTMLNHHLQVLAGENHPLVIDTARADKLTFSKVESRITAWLTAQSLALEFRFGRFLERSVFRSFDNTVPETVEINRFREGPMVNALPQGVSNKLKKLLTAHDPAAIRDICLQIADIFFE